MRGGGGFSFPVTADAYVGAPYSTGNVVYDTASNKIVEMSNLYGTTGKGGTVRLAAGYMFNPNFGLDLEFYGHLGVNQLVARTQRPLSDEVYTKRERSNQLRTVISMVVDAGFAKVSPYARFGMVLPLTGKTIRKERTETPTQYSLQELHVMGSFSVGLEACAGVRYNVTSRLGLFAEVNIAALRVKAAKGKIVLRSTYDSDGNLLVDDLETARTYTKEFNFVEKITTQSNTLALPDAALNFDMDKPTDVLAQKGAYNALGIQIGVRYRFGAE